MELSRYNIITIYFKMVSPLNSNGAYIYLLEQEDGSYRFEDAIRANGSDKCEMKVEKPG